MQPHRDEVARRGVRSGSTQIRLFPPSPYGEGSRVESNVMFLLIIVLFFPTVWIAHNIIQAIDRLDRRAARQVGKLYGGRHD